MLLFEHLLTLAALFLIISILVSKMAARFGVPALLLFLLLGMLAGSDGPGGIYFDNPWLTQSVGVVALAFILFSGGLDTRWHEVRPVLRLGFVLSTLGVLVTALAVGAFAVFLLGFSWAEGILLGAIIASTDAAAVFSVLRGKDIRLHGQLKPLLELESGSNDPMAVFLTIGMTQLVANPTLSPLTLLPLFAQQMVIGGAAGYLIGRGVLWFINRLRLEYDGLYPVLTIAMVLLTYGATASLGGNGFLAVYLLGVMLARGEFVHKRSLLQFHDGLAWLMQIAMFLTLGLQVFPSRLPSVAGAGLLVALFLIFIARPLSVFAAMAFTRIKLAKKLFIAWVGLRGAAPIVLATFPYLAGLERADTYFHLVFFIVLTSILLQGTLILPVARWLGVYDPSPPTRSPLAYVTRDGVIANDLIEMTVPEGAEAVGRQILDLHLPKDALVVLIGRGATMIVPRGDTIIRSGDIVLVMVSGQSRDSVRHLFDGNAAQMAAVS